MTNSPWQPDAATMSTLRNKWGFKELNVRSQMGSLILENQAKHFKRLTEESKKKTQLTDEFVDRLFRAMKVHIDNHPLLALCSIQAMTGPIGGINWYSQQYSESEGLPTVKLNLDEKEICAESRRVKARFQPKEIEDAEGKLEEMGWDSPAIIDMVVEELFTEVAREILGTMYNLCDPEKGTRVDYVAEGDTLATQVHRTAHKIHKQTQRVPANNLIGNRDTLTELGVEMPEKVNGQVQDLGVYNDRYRVYLDPLFPEGKLMMWYQGEGSPFDTGIIYSPYIMFELTPTFIDPPDDMSVTRAVRMRHKITVVRPEFFRVIEL